MKIFLSGAALALATGLLLGGAMQPHLDAGDDRPAGPQMLMGPAGSRAEGPVEEGAAWAGYPGKTPDYVLGTDWKTPMPAPDERAAAAAPSDDAASPQSAAELRPTLARVADAPMSSETAPQEHGPPSLGGSAQTWVIELAPARLSDNDEPSVRS